MAKHILLMDDDPNLSLALDFLLRQQGYRVSSVSEGEQVLPALAEDPPDLLLLDIGGSQQEAYQLCEQIRANPAWKSVKILMLSAQAHPLEQEKALALGADDYLCKPFGIDVLLNKLLLM